MTDDALSHWSWQGLIGWLEAESDHRVEFADRASVVPGATTPLVRGPKRDNDVPPDQSFWPADRAWLI